MTGHSQILAGIRNFQPFETSREKDNRVNRQYRAQLQLLARTTCQSPILGALNRRLSSVNAGEMKKMLQEDYYNGRVLKTVQCLVESISITTSSEMAVNYRIREFFRKLRQIGSPSVQGMAFQTGVQDVDKMFAIKVPRNPTDPAAYHEALIGLRGLNNYRSIIPNFAYVFGVLRTSQPAVAVDKQVITWSNNTVKPVPHVIYEYIPGPELNDYLKNCSFEDMLNVYLQACLALNVVFEGFDYTHYDAHTGNLLIRPVGHSVSIPYPTQRGTEYLTTQVVATFIDYGFAHGRIDGQMYGAIGYEDIGVEQRKSMPFHDAYKLLMFMLYKRRAYKKRDYLRFEPLIQIWNGNVPLDVILDEQREDIYSLPRICISEGRACFKDVDLLKWVEEIRRFFSKETGFLSSQPSAPVFSCTDQDCASESKILSDLGLAGIPKVASSIQYFDLMSRPNLRPEIRKSIDKLDVEGMFVRGLNQAEDLKSQLLVEISGLTRYRLTGAPEVYLTETYLRKYQDYAQNLAGIYDLFSNISILLQSLDFIAHTKKIPVRQLNNLRKQVQDQFLVMRTSAVAMRQDIRIVENIRSSSLARRRRQQIPSLKWYWEYLPNYLGMLETPLKI